MVVLASRVYVKGRAKDRALAALRSLIENLLGDLEVRFEIGLRHDEFPSVTIDGPDATVARNILAEEWGVITPTLTPGETYVGTLEEWSDDGIVLNAGQDIEVPASQLGLGPGSPSQIRERFGLVQHLRMQFEVSDPPQLAEPERDRLYDWQRGPGRVNVNSVTRSEVRATVNRAEHANDIVTVERLGLLEHSIVCAEGTDPPGLLASIGEYLPAELKCVIP